MERPRPPIRPSIKAWPRTDKNMQEEWKDVPGYSGYYRVSNFGDIVSYNACHGDRRKNAKLIKGHKTQSGYIQVRLSNNYKVKSFLVHRLVAQAFIPNSGNKPFINHKDGVKDNNHIDNLEWVTQSENMRHSYDVLKQPMPPGAPRPVRCVETGIIYKSAAEAQRRTGIAKTNIGKVALARKTGGKRLGHTNLTAGGYTWEFT